MTPNPFLLQVARSRIAAPAMSPLEREFRDRMLEAEPAAPVAAQPTRRRRVRRARLLGSGERAPQGG
jgi:hypothetical protein